MQARDAREHVDDFLGLGREEASLCKKINSIIRSFQDWLGVRNPQEQHTSKKVSPCRSLQCPQPLQPTEKKESQKEFYARKEREKKEREAARQRAKDEVSQLNQSRSRSRCVSGNAEGWRRKESKRPEAVCLSIMDFLIHIVGKSKRKSIEERRNWGRSNGEGKMKRVREGEIFILRHIKISCSQIGRGGGEEKTRTYQVTNIVIPFETNISDYLRIKDK